MAGTSRHRNLLLDSLPPASRQRLFALCEGVQLGKGTILAEAGEPVRYAFFLTAGVASLVGLTPDGLSVQFAMVGTDGFVGLPIVLGSRMASERAVVQLAGSGLRLRADLLHQEWLGDAEIRAVLSRYAGRVLVSIGQSVVCHRFHTVLDRTCAWLLRASRLAGIDTFPMTQEELGRLLGAPRTTVSDVAVQLQTAGLITCRHGSIAIRDRPRLEKAACECYERAQSDADAAPTASLSKSPPRRQTRSGT